MDNKVTFGLQNVHIAFRDLTAGSQPAWKVPQAIAGAVKFTPQAQGDSSTFYADNSSYYVVTANNGYQAELEMALIPDAILKEMMGWSIDSNGMLVEEADATPKEFALMGQVQGDQKNRRFVYYACTAQRPSKEHSTKGENLDPATDKLTLTIVPVDISGKKVTKGTIELSDTNATAYNGFFTTVYKPTFAQV